MDKTGYVLIRGTNYDDFTSIKGIYLAEKDAIKAAQAYKKQWYPGYRWTVSKVNNGPLQSTYWTNKLGVVICIEAYPLHEGS